MAIIPEKIINNGYEWIGLLSTQYYNIHTDQFIVGLYEKNNLLYLIVSADKQTFLIFNISLEETNQLMKDEFSLLEFLKYNRSIDSIPVKRNLMVA
jgi:hypothetical protein